MEKPQPAPMLFSTFIMGLASATLIELGVIEDPSGNPKRFDKEAARQHIDLLTMLSQKTRGNLDKDEQQLMEQVLTDLRLQFAKSVESFKKT